MSQTSPIIIDIASNCSEGQCNHNHLSEKSNIIREMKIDYLQQRQLITNSITKMMQHDNKHNELIELVNCLRELDCNYKKYLKSIRNNYDQYQRQDNDIAHTPQPVLQLNSIGSYTATNNDLFCYVCEKYLSSKDELLQHIQSHSSEFCDECDSNYLIIDVANKSNSCCIKHKFIKDLYYNNLIKCKQCSFNTIIQNEFKTHLETSHANQSPFKCQYCSESFKYEIYLQIHHETHHQYYFCAQCQYSTKYKQEYDTHLGLHAKSDVPHNNAANLFNSGYRGCNQSFDSYPQTITHRKNKHIEWQCEYCQQIFPTKDQMTVHKNTTHSHSASAYNGNRNTSFRCSNVQRRFGAIQQPAEPYPDCDQEGLPANRQKRDKQNRNVRKRLRKDSKKHKLTQKKRKIAPIFSLKDDI